MYSGGIIPSTPGMRQALTGPPYSQDSLAAAQDRSQRRMHSVDTASLQAEVDELRQYVTALFRLLVARGVFTVEEAQHRLSELAGESGGAAARDVVSGTELPPEENPFRGLGGASGPLSTGKRARRWSKVLAAGALVLAASVLWVAIFAGWVR